MNLNLEDLKKDLGLCKIDVSDEKRTSTETLFKASGITYKYYDVYEFKKEQYISYLTQIVDDAQAKGLYIKYNTNVEQIKKENLNNETVFSIITNGKDGISIYFAKKVVLATGNIDDSTKLIQDLINKEPKNFFEIGIRITVPTDKISSILDSHGDLKLKYKDGRTYCVSKNGFIIAYSVNDALFLEGYIDNTITSNLTNFAVIIKCDDQNMLKEFKENYIKKYRGIPIRQGYNDYINNKISIINSSEKYIPIQQGNVNDLFSDVINSRIIEFIEDVLIGSIGLNRDDIVVYAPELKETDCFEINTDFRVTNNVFVIGAATGKFRGILQSMCSGKHCADIVRR